MSRRGRIARVVVAALMSAPLLIVIGVLIVANTDPGRRWIESATSRLSHGQVALQGLGGRFPDRLHLDSLRLSDPQGLWLEADNVELDTMPTALLARRVEVQRFQVAHLAVKRRPDYGPAAQSSSSEGSSFRDIRVDTLTLQRVDLDASLTGVPSAFRIDGTAYLQSSRQARLQLSARRLDSVPCNYEAHALFYDRQVEASVDVQEEKGGALTELARVPDLGRLELHLRLQGPREAVRTELHLIAGPLTANANGSVDLDKPAADLKMDAASPAINPMFGVSWQQLSLNGEIHGTPAAPNASAQLRLTGLTSAGSEIHDINATLHSGSDQVILDGAIRGLNLQSPQLVLPDSKPIMLHAESRLGDKSLPVDFTLTSPLLDARGHWNAGSGDGVIDANVADIHPLMAIGGQDLKGRGTLQAKFDLKNGAGHLDTLADLHITGGESPLAPLLRPHTTATARVLFRPDGLEFKDTRIDAAHARLALSGTVLGAGMDVRYQVSIPELAALSPQLKGNLKTSGTVRGKAPALVVEADANGELSAHGTPSGPLHLVLRAQDVPRQPRGSLRLNGELDAAPIDLVATASTATDGGLLARIEHGSWKSAQIQGDVRADAKGEHARGNVELRVERLADLDRLIGQPLQGAVHASVALHDQAGVDRADVDVAATDVGLPAQQVQMLHLRGQIERPLTQPSMALTLEARTQFNDRAGELHAQARGPLNKLELSSRGTLAAVGDGDKPDNAAAQFDEDATIDIDRSQVRLTALNADYHKTHVHLLAPAVIAYGSELKVDQLRLASGDAQLTLAGRLSPTLALRATLKNLSAAQLQLISPSLAINGQVNASADLGGELAHPTGDLEMHASGLQAGGDNGQILPPSNVDLKAKLADTVARVDLQVRAGQGLNFALEGTVPLSAQGQIDAKANGAFDVNLLNPILEAQGQHVQGAVRVNAQLTGTGRAPQARGNVVLAGISVQDYVRGIRLSDIQATVNADGETLTLRQLSAKAGPGTVTADGTVKLGNSDWPVDVRITGRNAQLLASDLVTANLDLDASISGALRTQLTTGGTVRINRAVINIPSALPPNLPTLHIVRPGDGAAPPAASHGPSVALDYRVSALHAIFVRGRGIDSEFGGQIHVQGSTEKIAITGGFDMVKGSIAMGGTTLQFDRDSRLAFNGTGVQNKIDPTLDFTATNNTGTATSATLKVTGYADAPVLTLSSVPEMPQDQILSQLLFGTSNVSSLSPLQLASIGSALVTLGGVGGGGGGGFNPINTVQKKLGLDRLSIGSGGSSSGGTQQPAGSGAEPSGTTIEAGRYVSSRVYVGAKENTEGSTQAEVQVDLTQRLKLQATLATGGGSVQGATPQNDPGSSAGVAYQLDY